MRRERRSDLGQRGRLVVGHRATSSTSNTLATGPVDTAKGRPLPKHSDRGLSRITHEYGKTRCGFYPCWFREIRGRPVVAVAVALSAK